MISGNPCMLVGNLVWNHDVARAYQFLRNSVTSDQAEKSQLLLREFLKDIRRDAAAGNLAIR